MRRHALLLLTPLIAVLGCARPDQNGAPATSSAEETLNKALRSYAVEFLRRNPTTNTYLGGAGLDPSLHGVDGTLRDYSPGALDQEDQWLMATTHAIEAIAPDSLSTRAKIDREVALAQIRFMLRQHMVRLYQQRALDTYVGEPFRALDWQLQGLSQTGASTYGTADDWRLVVKRVGAIPQFLSAARVQLEGGIRASRIPDKRMIQRDGIATAEANAKYFAETLPALAADRIAGSERDDLVKQLRSAGQQASDAYLMLRDFVARSYFEGTKPAAPNTPGMNAQTVKLGDRFAMGETEYDWALVNNFKLDKTAGQLYDEAWPIVQKTRDQLIGLAREVGNAHRWPLPADGLGAVRAVFDELSKDYPRSDSEMIQWYRDTAFRLVDFGRKSGIFDVPADYKLDVVETPAPLQASVDGAAYYPAPPFKNSGVGRFYVTPTHNDQAALQSNNRAALADLAAHEGFPGHDWYYKVLTQARDQVSPVRWLTPGAVEDSSSMWEDSMAAEGWGLYAEALMAEPQPGAATGFYTPEERLYQLQGELYRDLRVRIDTGIHTGRLSYDEAVTLFSEVVDFLPGSCTAPAGSRTNAKRASCESAERAIFRYSKWPTQAITYRLGKDQIYALRADAATRLGERFSAKTFHLFFIREGTVPPGYFADTLLHQLQQAK